MVFFIILLLDKFYFLVFLYIRYFISIRINTDIFFLHRNFNHNHQNLSIYYKDRRSYGRKSGQH